MKYIVRFFVITFLFIGSTHVLAEQSIAFMDMKQILNNSKAGKGAQDYLKKTFNEKQKEFMETEKELKKEEEKLISSKDKLTKDEYKKKSDALRKQVAKYQTDRRQALEKIGKQRTEAKKMLLSKLDPILKNYRNRKTTS